MFTNDMIARSHFTSKEDGRNSFNQFLKSLEIEDEIPSFEYKAGKTHRGKEIVFVADSWGGYFDMSNRWVVFIAWRCPSIKVTSYIRWFWDEKQQKCYGMEETQFVG